MSPFAWPAWLVALPFLAAVATALGGRRTAAAVGALAVPAILALSVALAVETGTGGPVRHELGGWPAPLGIALVVDGTSAALLLLASLLGAVATVYVFYYAPLSEENRPRSYFWPLWFFLWGALNALFVAGDLFNLYITLEILTLAAVALVALEQGREALIAAMRYLLAAMVGSMSYLLGVALIYAEVGALDLVVVARHIEPTPATWLAAALMTAGLLVKTALFPFHFWLPPAHANALAPVSALLSGVVAKASFYLVLRLWFGPFADVIAPLAWHALGALGVGAIVWGAVQALNAKRLKLIVAYSTVSQIGYLFLLFPLAQSAALATAWDGALYHLSAHAIAKAAVFLAAGNVLYALGHDRIANLAASRGALKKSLFALALGAVSLMGLPPSGGFIGKWLLLNASLESGQLWLAATILIGSVLAASYLFRVLRLASGGSADAAARVRPVPPAMEYSALFLAVAAVLLGLAGAPLLALFEVGAPYGGSARP